MKSSNSGEHAIETMQVEERRYPPGPPPFTKIACPVT